MLYRTSGRTKILTISEVMITNKQVQGFLVLEIFTIFALYFNNTGSLVRYKVKCLKLVCYVPS